jgi:hypothetical protein
MSCETNILKENNELRNEVKNLSNKLERCYNSKVTFEHMLKSQRNLGDMSGIGFNKSNIKGKRWGKKRYEREMKKQEQMKLSHFMCFKCNEAGHLANSCPNEEKLKLKKEEERLKHVKCFKCRTWDHLTLMCPAKQMVKHQVKPQPKPQIEQEEKLQDQIKINHEDGGDLLTKKKKTRRGEKARERALRPRINQDAKKVSKNKEEKIKEVAHIKCHSCDILGHLASGCPNKLEKKAQANKKKQDNEKHHMSKEEKAQLKRKCYSCRERGYMANSCPLGNTFKPISIDDNNVLRKDGNGASMVAIAKQPAIHTKAMPKYDTPNLRGPKLV